MIYQKKWMLLSILVLLQGCHAVSQQQKSDTPLINHEIPNQQYLTDSVNAYTQDKTTFKVAFDDLNADGHLDAIVLLSGMNWCGSGGCTLLVFEGKTDQHFKFISKTTLVDSPIYSTINTHNAWKQISVYSRKHGQVLLSFDGQGYSANPSLLPVQDTILNDKNAKLLLKE